MLKRRSTFSITKINFIWKSRICDTHRSPANKPARDDKICIFNLLTVLMILGEADTSPVSAESKHPLSAELFPGYRNELLGLWGCNNTRHCKAPEETSVVTSKHGACGCSAGSWNRLWHPKGSGNPSPCSHPHLQHPQHQPEASARFSQCLNHHLIESTKNLYL